MKRSLLTALMVPVLLAGSLNAASDYLLELDGVKGESKDSAHPGTIEIESFSWGIANETSTLPTAGGGGGGAGKVSMQDFHFVARVSKASPKLMLACATGQHIAKATLFVRKTGGDGSDFYTMELKDVLVRKVHNSGRGASSTAGDSMPMEEVAFYFENATLRYVAEDGSVTTGTTLPPNPQ